jgi:anaerobic magnesium-protoporphyrin IX monomethyl ester cyclase
LKPSILPLLKEGNIPDRIVLLNFPPAVDYSYADRGTIYPGPAVMLIGTYLKQNGYEVHLIDGAYHEDYLDRLRTILAKHGDEILYVGMSVMVTQIPFALEASRMVKGNNGGVRTVWGGPHPTLYSEQTLKNENVDIVVINEGTVTALRLAEAIRKEESLDIIKGIGYKNRKNMIHFTGPGELEDIEALPYFDFSFMKIDNYINPESGSVYKREFPGYNGPIRMMPILTGLGCPYKCQFCINVILKRKYRHRSAASIIGEIKRLQSFYGANTFLFLDEDFFINKKRILELVSLAEKEGLHFNMRVWCRVDHFKDNYLHHELLKRLSGIGHLSIAMGGESASPEILKDLKKGITPNQIIHSLKVITECGNKIFPRYSFMVGLENETLDQIRKTYQFCMDMGKINPMVDIAGPFIFRLYPGSPIFNRLVEQYRIPMPDSLDSWSEHVTNVGSADKMPWTPLEFQRKKELISFYATYALRYFDSHGSFGMRVGRVVLSKLSRMRIKLFFFTLPFEYWIYTFLKSKFK